jgi:predicted Zn finger-like uncharacterized protein
MSCLPVALAMRILCPNCSSSYEVPDGSISATGRKVRCQSCKTIWVAMPEADIAALEDQNTPALDAESTSATSDDLDRPLVDAESMMTGEASFKSANRAAEVEEHFDEEPNWDLDPEPSAGNDQDSVDAMFAVEPEASDAPVAEVMPAAASPVGKLDQQGLQRAPGRGKKKRGLLNIGGKAISEEARIETRFAVIAFGLLFVSIVVAMAFRATVVAAVPQAAALYKSVGLDVNLRGLEIRNVRTQVQDQDGTRVMTVQGQVFNAGKIPREIPRLYLAIKGEDGQELYSWTATVEGRAVPGGATVSFRRRLASPPEDGKSVMVRFAGAGENGSSRPPQSGAPSTP